MHFSLFSGLYINIRYFLSVISRVIVISIIFCLISTPQKAYSHPHVLLTTSLEFIFEGDTCNGFWLEWIFDDIFGTSVIQEFDEDHNGAFDKKELKKVYNEAFSNLKKYGYFIFIRKDKTRKHPEKVENFSAYQKLGRLVYRFYVPLKDKNLGSDFYIAIFDKTFYCDIKYSSRPAVIRQKNGRKPVYKIVKNEDYPVYYNPLGGADDLRVYRKWKPGLETAYPKEIHIYFKSL
ncbi:MAG: DUF1007 family protein [Spirochaetes bacterium]|nr:DUF1007 family protein [Spirochaetota bacterium]